MFFWFKNFFHKKEPVNPKKVLVIFDGDQGILPFNLLHKKLPHVWYHWVQNSKMSTPKKIKHAKIPITVPADHGKESVDTYIAMKVVRECSRPRPPSDVYIVSRDLDFVDVIINAAIMFPKTKFTLMIHRTGKPTRTFSALPQNAFVQHFRMGQQNESR